jgi:hypothetical protein
MTSTDWGRKMSKLLKTLFFMVLLAGTGYYFGRICREMHSAYQLILLPSAELLTLLLKFLLASGLLLVAAGLVGVLLHPFWVGFAAFCLSGLAMLLGWKITPIHLGFILAYILAGTFYVLGLARELKARIHFSAHSVSVGQNLLSMSLALLACGSIYLSCQEYIHQEGFSIPEPYIEIMMEQFEKQIELPTSEEDHDAAIAEFREGFRRNIQNMVNERLKPYEGFVPLAIAAGLFMTLVTAINLLSWISNAILGFIFPLLKALRVTKVVSQTQEVSWIVID